MGLFDVFKRKREEKLQKKNNLPASVTELLL